MNPQLKLLVELQQMDSQIIERAYLVKQIPFKIESAMSPLKQAKVSLEEKKRAYEAAVKRKRELDSELEDMGQKITKLKAQTSGVKTNKEYHALLKEIEAAEASRFAHEDSILSAMEQIESSEKEIKTEEKKVKEEEARVEVFRQDLEKQKEAASLELKELKGKRAAFASQIAQDAYELYMSLLKDLGGVAVAQAKGEVCGGCHMNIMPQLYVHIKQNSEIHQCPQCRRILFYKEEPVEEPAK
ncbi:MAG: C4-type zinc ribbon domain-containing protein [Actinomycetota bacterium]|nr:C4-type zinc ribbon domain-containing protein [Actinomycetota bacterium]